ncbi:alpha/beta hydrolase [Paractinoplanes hotanensis]|uniref:Alpha/beta hydrolase n=1 Tax=Paractinoplanes hotanensis TaxID=2906497 RepID=A0ABT0Y8U9_9ACTN|nr:alpha/beta hydrolase [Actinoplanes hotanensis]MCM4082468.1 alpha/beta hydrolase [Actinoplanes hotanensis]
MVRLRVALVVLVVLALILTAIWFLQRRLIYFPDRATPPLVAGAEPVTLHTSDGLRLGSWLFRPPSGTPDQGTAVLVAPGNAGNRLGRAPLAAALAAEGFTVLLLDYRGYGGNPGRPSEEGLARDADAARAFLAERAGTRLVYLGESLGAAVVTGLATRHPPEMLVLRSPFADLGSAAREHYPFLPVRLLLRDEFPVARPIRTITVPTLVVYGTADSVVPPEQSITVADDAAGPVRVVAVEGGGHNDDYREPLVEGLLRRSWS